MAIIKKKVRGKEIDWDTTLGGPVAHVPPQEGVEGYQAPVGAINPVAAAMDAPIVDDIQLSPAAPAKSPKAK